MSRLIAWLRTAYRTIALQGLAVILVLAGINAIAWVALQGRDLIKATGIVATENDPWAKRQAVYPGMPRNDIFTLHIESWERQQWAYEPLAQFKEAPYAGKFVNITEAGYRKGGLELPWPPAPDRFNVFVFGNSTTFSYGLPDNQTVPAALQEVLAERAGHPVAVYNFGRAYYYSTHELLLFQRLLMEGSIPDVAIFVDGINEFYHHDREFAWTDRLTRYVAQNRPTTGNMLASLIHQLPAMELYVFVRGFIGRSRTDGNTVLNAALELPAGTPTVDPGNVINKFRRNQRLIRSLAALYHVKPYFIWQPAPTYKYDTRYHLFAEQALNGHEHAAAGFVAVHDRFKVGDMGDDFTWCADIQDGIAAPLYVDTIHYTARLARMVAECIAPAIAVTPRQ